MPSRRLLLSFLALVASSCAHTGDPAARLKDAAHGARSPNAAARTLSLAGFHALLVEGQVAQAQEHFDAALIKDNSEPYAHLGRLLIAQRNAHPEGGLEEALRLLEAGPPNHPLQAIAAREVVEMAGQSLVLDAQIAERVPKAMARGLTGEAALLLRGALAAIALERGDFKKLEAIRSDMGSVTQATLVGPFTALRYLTFDEPLAPEKDGSLDGVLKGPLGDLKLRTLSAPDGRLQLTGEPPLGDGYVLAVDFDVGTPTLHTLVVAGPVSFRATLDGTLLTARHNFGAFEPTTNAVGIALAGGHHRLVVRVANDEHGGVSIALPRTDGQPAGLRLVPAQGRAPRWGGVAQAPSFGFFPHGEDLARALAPETGEGLASFLAAYDSAVRDRDGARALVAGLGQSLPTAALLTLEAKVSLGDRSLPPKVARGRATRDLDVALERDPKNVEALLLRAGAALEDSRLPEASELLERARKAYTPPGFPVLLLEARLGLALNVDAQAEVSSEAALATQPGLCDALSLRFELAQRRDAAKRADALLQQLRGCPGALARSIEHARTRGDLARAVSGAETLLAREPASVSTALRLAGLYSAQRKFADALRVLRASAALWPREAGLRKKEADVLASQGDKAGALATREVALLLDGDDLPLRRSVELAKTGKELLQEFAVDTRKAVADYQAKKLSEDAAATYILDAAATRAYRDGSMVDRIHVIQKVLDQSAVAELAEVNVPPGAHVLALRTLKADGRVLEPESIEGKDTISLPGVAVGDSVEYEYLLAHGPRGPAVPGFTASNFYYQIARQPDHDVTYTVVAPKGSDLRVDIHHMKAPSPLVRGDEEMFHFAIPEAPPFIPEPDAPPSINEYLPFVSVGAGSQGQDALMTAYGDILLERGRVSHEIRAFAREAAHGKSGDALVAAIYDAVMATIGGRDEGLGVSAVASLAQMRGSRLWLLKAALESQGVEARVSLVRPFSSDPAPYLFPTESLFSYAVLRVQPPGGREQWLDPTVRFAPLGALPDQVSGGRDAYILPEPGRPLARAKTPLVPQQPGKQVQLQFEVDKAGTLSGTGSERYEGLDAAQLAEALEALSPGERDQALQSALTRFFGGAELSGLAVAHERAVGAPLTVTYKLRAPGFARVEDGKLILPPVTFPAFLGKRYVQLNQRKTPLFIDDAEQNEVHVALRVPAGYHLVGAVGDVKTASPFGWVRRRESQHGDLITIEEDFRLEMARVSPDQYDEFSQFAGEVDLLQSRDLVVEPPGGHSSPRQASGAPLPPTK